MTLLSPQLLKSLNITEAQAAVYLAALELGQSTMQALAKKSGVKRTSIYNFIDEMKGRQLLVETRRKKRNMYSAAAPEQLIEIEKTRLHELHKLMPELTAIQNTVRTKPRVTFFEGKEGIKHAYADSLSAKREICAFSDYEVSSTIMGDPFYKDYYIPERVKRDIMFRVIMKDSPDARRYAEHNTRDLRESKFIQGKGVATEIVIYNDTVATMSFRAKVPFAVLVEDKDIADSLREVWKELWDKLGDVGKYQESLLTEATENID